MRHLRPDVAPATSSQLLLRRFHKRYHPAASPRVDHATSYMPPTSKAARGAKARTAANPKPAPSKSKPRKGKTKAKAKTSTKAKEQPVSNDEELSDDEEPPRRPQPKKRKARNVPSDAKKKTSANAKRQQPRSDEELSDDEKPRQPKKRKTRNVRSNETESGDGDGASNDEGGRDDQEASDGEEAGNDGEASDGDGASGDNGSADDGGSSDDKEYRPLGSTTRHSNDEDVDDSESSDHKTITRKPKKRSQARAPAQRSPADEQKTADKGKASVKRRPQPTKKRPKPTIKGKAMAPPDAAKIPSPTGIHPALATAWKINPKMESRMHFIFDAVPPFVEYQRGVEFERFPKFRRGVEPPGFPERGDITPDDMTDSQGDTPDHPTREWMSYGVRGYEYAFTSCDCVPLLIPFLKPQVACRL